MIENNPYASYMLRFRRAQTAGQPTWIVSAQSTQTGEMFLFPSLDGLVQFLQIRFGTGVEAGAANQATIPGNEEPPCTAVDHSTDLPCKG